ncbi:MAG: phenylalanine--tRNA ligase subunit beta [Rhabdochlamydiaceae bacterium]|nr:phenylalanine--tRNA ligase subunit beta [Rhabdochlamydiaceae bacterium]
MKVPLSWLKEYVPLSFSPEQIAEALTLAGLEVDEIHTPSFSFEGVVIAKVLETTAHPNADRLKIAKVFDGEEEHQVVCGAANCRPGLITAFAKLGATLKDQDGKPWKIKKSKIREVESFGMLCAADELGLSIPGEGILELPADSPLGMDITNLYADTVFDITLTPNLGHCMSIYGIARELSALFEQPLKKIISEGKEPTETPSFSVEIEDNKHCLQYSCRLIKNIQVGPSPAFLVQKLQTVGLKSINNVVDISNYVMMLTGQPLHFFDADTIEGKKIFIRATSAKTNITTLDSTERELPEGALVISDTKNILAVAGVIGSLSSSVQDTTKNILIEAAIFHSGSVRKTSKALNLKTDASQRFEKGTDSSMVPLALNLAADLLTQVALGSSSEKKAESIPHPSTPLKIVLRKERVNHLLGTLLSITEITSLLERLHIKITKEEIDHLEALIPFHRNDLKEEIDLIEEVARLYGFNNLPKKAPLYYTSPLADSPVFSFENKIRNLLLQEGLQEFMTCDLISPKLSELTIGKNQGSLKTLSVLQSKSIDYSVLRHSLLPGLLQIVKYNVDRESKNIAGFEVGRVHFEQNGIYEEHPSLAILLSGESTPHHHDPKPRFFDFFDLKGMVENVLQALHIDACSFVESHLPNFQPGRQAYIEKDQIRLGVLGEIHPTTLSSLDISPRVYFAELHLEELLKHQKIIESIADLPLYPSSERDWTVSLKKEVPIQEILSCIQELAPPLLEKIFLLDLFESPQIGNDRKNATWRFVYRDPKKTLDLPTVEALHTKLLQMVAEKLSNCIW